MEYLISKEKGNCKYYFYKTTNIINGKFYYGSGSKQNYIGSGRAFQHALLKYGKECFIHERLRYFKTREDAFRFEEKFLCIYDIKSLEESYNLINKGQGKGREILESYDPDYKICLGCEETKENSEFSPDKRNKDGLYSYCRDCYNLMSRKPHRHISKVFQRLRKKYTIEVERKDFIEYYLQDIMYKKLYSKWEDSNYSLDLTPSFILKDVDKPVRFDNIKVITKKELCIIIGNRSKDGTINMKQKRVGAFKDDKLIYEFISVREAGRSGFHLRSIFRCLSGERKRYKEYEWMYLE
jgi:hypothetical protein